LLEITINVNKVERDINTASSCFFGHDREHDGSGQNVREPNKHCAPKSVDSGALVIAQVFLKSESVGKRDIQSARIHRLTCP